MRRTLDDYVSFSRANRSAAESVWENYHDVDRRLSVMSTNGTLSAGAAIIRMEPKGDLQLHPNYGAACQVSLDSFLFDASTRRHHSSYQASIVFT